MYGCVEANIEFIHVCDMHEAEHMTLGGDMGAYFRFYLCTSPQFKAYNVSLMIKCMLQLASVGIELILGFHAHLC